MMMNSRLTATVGGLLVLFVAADAGAQGAAPSVHRVALVASGSIAGIVQDEAGAAVAGALVSALGRTSVSTVTDTTGRFELHTLPPGPYVLRARQTGFVASDGRVVEVRPSARVDSSIALRRIGSSGSVLAPSPVLAAGMGSAPQPQTLLPAGGRETTEPAASATPSPAETETTDADGRGEMAWRLQHARRGVLKDVTFPDDLLAGNPPAPATNIFSPLNLFGRTGGSTASLAASFLTSVPFSGQVNLLTIGSVNDDGPEMFARNSFSRGTAYVSVGAPVGDADWTMRGALTDGDRPAWFAAAAYTTRVPARQRYDVGFSYSTQRYDSANPATYALREATERGHYAGALYGFDTLTLTRVLSIAYGARVERYDYLESGLVSPRIALTISPTDHFRVSALASRRALAPGAEEFLPPIEPGLSLPPQRTFSSLVEGQPLSAERTTHLDVEAARDVGDSTVSARVFHQHVDGQLVTLFGVDSPDGPGAHLGHYFVSSNGNVDAIGWSAAFRAAALAHRVHGSVEYSRTRARWYPTPDAAYAVLLAPSTGRLESENVDNVSTKVETDVPETSTRVMIVYQVSNAFARPVESTDRLDARFDVQVRQALHFMDFGTARWEMLVAVRNFFREGEVGSSVYDELLVIHPPKRVVGGLTMRF